MTGPRHLEQNTRCFGTEKHHLQAGYPLEIRAGKNRTSTPNGQRAVGFPTLRLISLYALVLYTLEHYASWTVELHRGQLETLGKEYTQFEEHKKEEKLPHLTVAAPPLEKKLKKKGQQFLMIKGRATRGQTSA